MKSSHPDTEVPENASRKTTALLRGFTIALLASVSWGVGNTVLQYSTEKYTSNSSNSAVIDIALANYIGGCAALLLISLVLHQFRRSRGTAESLSYSPRPKMVVPAFFKSLNTYSFVASVALISAAAAATLENLNVLWTALIISIIARKLLNWSWFTSALIVIAGTALVVGFSPAMQLDARTIAGLTLAVAAGLTFSGFVITWTPTQLKTSYLPQRGIETGIFLAMAMIGMLIIHYLGGKELLGGSWLPLTTIKGGDLALQLFNGTFSVGITYFLMAEAARIMSDAGGLADVLLSLGVSFAVLFTVISSWLILDTPVVPAQLGGVALFSVGFVTVQVATRRSSE